MTTFDHRSWMLLAWWLVLELHAHCTGFPQSVHMPKHQQFQRVVGQTLTQVIRFMLQVISVCDETPTAYSTIFRIGELCNSGFSIRPRREAWNIWRNLQFFSMDSMRRCQANGGFGAAQTAKTYLSHTTRRHSLTPQLANSKQFFFFSEVVATCRHMTLCLCFHVERLWKDKQLEQTSSSDNVLIVPVRKINIFTLTGEEQYGTIGSWSSTGCDICDPRPNRMEVCTDSVFLLHDLKLHLAPREAWKEFLWDATSINKPSEMSSTDIGASQNSWTPNAWVLLLQKLKLGPPIGMFGVHYFFCTSKLYWPGFRVSKFSRVAVLSSIA